MSLLLSFPIKHPNLLSLVTLSDLEAALSGSPTPEEICALSVENVWYPLGLWLGVDEGELRRIEAHYANRESNSHSFRVKEMFRSFLSQNIHDKFMSDSGLILVQKSLVQNKLLVRTQRELPEEKENNLPSQTSSKYKTLISGLVKVGLKKEAEKLCASRGKCYKSYKKIELIVCPGNHSYTPS